MHNIQNSCFFLLKSISSRKCHLKLVFLRFFPRGEIIAHLTINFDKSDAHIDMGEGRYYCKVTACLQQFRKKVVSFLDQFAIFFVFEAFYFWTTLGILGKSAQLRGDILGFSSFYYGAFSCIDRKVMLAHFEWGGGVKQVLGGGAGGGLTIFLGSLGEVFWLGFTCISQSSLGRKTPGRAWQCGC